MNRSDGVILCLLSLLGILVFGLYQSHDLGLFFVTAVCIFINVLTILLEWTKERLFGPFTIFSTLLLGHFCLPLALESMEVSVYNLESLRQYAPSVALYILAISFSNLFLSLVKAPLPPNDNPLHVNERFLRNVIVLLVGIGLIARLYLISKNLYFQHSRGSDSTLSGSIWLTWLIGFERYPFYALTIASVVKMQSRSQSSRILFRIVWLLEIAYWLPAGRKEELAAALIIPVILQGMIRRESIFNIRNLAMAAALVAVFPVTRTIRTGLETLQFSALDQSLSIAEVITAMPEAYAAGEDKVKNSQTTLASGKESSANLKRLSLVESVSGCMHIARKEGFKFGKSYLFLFIFPIPRFLWKAKPQSTHGVEFGRKLGIVGRGDNSSISVSYVGESYWNFGVFGVIVIAIFLATLLRLYNVAQSTHHVLAFLIFVMFLRVFLYQGGEIGAYVAGFFKQLIVLSLLILLKNRSYVRLSHNN